MKRPLILWSAALLLTFLTGYIQSGTSEFYPVTGTIGIDEKKVSYRFEKLYNGKDNYKFIIRTDNPGIKCFVKWKNEMVKNWNSIEMKKKDEAFIAEIPRQEAGKKIFYFAEISKGEKKFVVPDKPVLLLFQGYVPSMISSLSFFTLFAGLLLSFRTGLEFFNENQKIKKLTLFTTSFFFLYTIAVTPLKKSFELNAINNKVVPVTSLFDLQSILLFLLWIAAMIIIFKAKDPKKPIVIFSILTVSVFLFVRI